MCDLVGVLFEVRSDQFVRKRVKDHAHETTPSQFVHSEEKYTTSITHEPDS